MRESIEFIVAWLLIVLFRKWRDRRSSIDDDDKTEDEEMML